MYFVYLHTSLISGKHYIGFTGKTVEFRFANHCSFARNGSNTHFHKAIRKYGEDSWSTSILANAVSENEAKALEVNFINQYRSNQQEYGYNMTPGGDGNSNTGKKLTKEHRDKVVAALERARANTTPEQYLERGILRRGEVRSDKARLAISTGMKKAKEKGLTASQIDQLRAMHSNNRGKERSSETKLKISEANKGKIKKSKLSENQIEEVLTSKLSSKELALKLSVHVTTINRIKKKRKAFKEHVLSV